MVIMLAITGLIGYHSQVRCSKEGRLGLLDGATTVTSDDVRGCDTPGSIATGTNAMDFGGRVGFLTELVSYSNMDEGRSHHGK